MIKPPIPTLSPVRTSIRVERLRACAAGVGLGDGVAVGVMVGVAEGVTIGLAVAVGVAVGVGAGVAQPSGPWIATVIGVPVLKKPIVAFVAAGG